MNATYIIVSRRDIDAGREMISADAVVHVSTDRSKVEKLLSTGAFAGQIEDDGAYMVLLVAKADARLNDVEGMPTVIAYYDVNGGEPSEGPPVTLDGHRTYRAL